MCKHDTQYTIDNKQAGGYGCPICAAEKRAQSGGAQTPTPVSFDTVRRTGHCDGSNCAECELDCEVMLGIQMAADLEDQRAEQAHPWMN